MELALEENIHSFAHLFYLDNRMVYKDTLHELEVLTAKVQSHENAIRRLVPDAVNWSSDEWEDEHTLLSALMKNYHADYNPDGFSLSRVIFLTEQINDGLCDDDTLWYIHAIEYLPFPLAKVLWPAYTMADYINMFHNICDRVITYNQENGFFHIDSSSEVDPVGHFSKEYVEKCWLYKLLKQWYEDDSLSPDVHHEIKSALFTVVTQM